MKTILIIAVCLLFLSISAFAQFVDSDWVRTYDGPDNDYDQPHDIYVDSQGNVYVTGQSRSSETLWDFFTLKYYQDGNEAWFQRYGGPGTEVSHAIIVDSSGNVYVTGVNTTIKYDADGNWLWNSIWCGFDIDLDSSDNVYIAGGKTDYSVIKLFPGGDTAWVRRYNGPGDDDDGAEAIALDCFGDIYVTGCSRGSGTGIDIATLKYDPYGNQLWVKRYFSSDSLWDKAIALTTDCFGNVYVTGASAQAHDSPYNFDFVTIKYDSLGNELWVSKYNGSGDADDYAQDIVSDDSGNIYVTGYSFGSSSYNDYATIKYDSSGNELWVKRYNGLGNLSDWAWSIAIDDLGNIYVSGESWGISTQSDIVTIKYDSQGNELWVERYDGPANFLEYGEAMMVDDSGNVYVTGGSAKSVLLGFDIVTIKYVQFYSGDVNDDGEVTISDVVYLVNYLFEWGPPPTPELWLGDVNSDYDVNVVDVVYLINYLFRSGPPPRQ